MQARLLLSVHSAGCEYVYDAKPSFSSYLHVPTHKMVCISLLVDLSALMPLQNTALIF